MEGKIGLEPGVPKGGILFPYICNLRVEILLLKITYTNTMTFATHEACSQSYAEDIFIKRIEQNFGNLVKIIANFSKISGLHANWVLY